MHFSRSRDTSGGTGDKDWQLGTGPNHYLLKSDPNDLCLACHDERAGIPDVLGSDINSITGGRSAGAHGGDVGSPWLRHPTADVDIGQNVGRKSSLAQYQSHVNRVQVMSATGNWQTGTDLTPSCFSCHKAHGNKNPFGLIYMRGDGALTEEGDAGTSGTMADLCRQCHV